jgi:hypothetical protein
MTTLAPEALIRHGVVATEPEPGRALAWTVWPARERPVRAACVTAGVMALGALAGFTMGDAWTGVIAALALAVSLHRFLLPTDVVLHDDGITVHEPLRVRHVQWDDVDGVIWRHDQGLLRAARDTHGRWLPRVGGLRGVIVPLGADPVESEARRRAVDGFIRRHGR